MTATKGLDPAVADKIGEYVKHKGTTDSRDITCILTSSTMAGGPPLLETLRSDAALMANPRAKAGIEEMGLLFTYPEV